MMTPIWRPYRACWCLIVVGVGILVAAYHHPYAAVIVTAVGMGIDINLRG